jgi:beta-N-acetylhexosaminidase
MDMQKNEFSIKQLAGQRLMVGFDGTRLNDDLKFLIDSLKVGGIILFSRNISGPEQLRDLCSSAQDYAEVSGQPPLFIATDQEGGQVARLKEPFTQFPGNPAIKNENDAEHFARVTATELMGVGINMDMAPVIDLAPEGMSSIMAERSFGHDPERVSAMGACVIEHLQHNGVMAVAKHFPGIGRTVLDSHVDLPTLEADMALLESSDFVPFEAAIKHDAAGIMLSHIVYEKIDPQWPASLSARIAKELLRERMGFKGLVITDDLDMGAIAKHYDIKKIISQILSADIDIPLICHKGPAIENAFEEILSALQNSEELLQSGIDSVDRIMAAKKKYLE